MIRRWLRRWLDISNSDAIDIMFDQFHKELALGLDNIRQEIFLLHNELSVTMGDEFDPKRQKLSQELGDRMRSRLEAEKKARALMVPEERE